MRSRLFGLDVLAREPRRLDEQNVLWRRLAERVGRHGAQVEDDRRETRGPMQPRPRRRAEP